MSTIIVGVSGRKSSGKSTLCAYLQAAHWRRSSHNVGDYQFEQASDGTISWFFRNGELKCPVDEPSTLNYDVGLYNFADELKETCINLLGLRPEQVWGTEADKNSLTGYFWGKLPLHVRRIGVEVKSGPMTAREVLQVFGTDIMRKMFNDDIWVSSCLRRIERDAPKIALIADMRFQSEFHPIHDRNGYVVRLGRKLFPEDTHCSEVDFDGFDFGKYERTLVVAPDVTQDEKNRIVTDWLFSALGV